MKNTKLQRKARISLKTRGTQDRPRLSVSRSNKGIQAQIIDDTTGKTLVGVSEKILSSTQKQAKTVRAKLLGQKLAELAKKHKITTVVFDKGAYRYHGRVKALADGAREGGLSF